MHQLLLIGFLCMPFSINLTTSEETAVYSGIPQRSGQAVSGSLFAKDTAHMSEKERQSAAVWELRHGNMPSFIRSFTPVKLTHTPKSGKKITAVIWVSPDYLSIGSDTDYLRIPLSYPSAVSVASAFGCILPTRKIVDAIYRQSSFRYTPQPMHPGPEMCSNAYFLEHQRRIERQRIWRDSKLVSGHKKDVVLTNLLWKKPNRIAIYGWHRPTGEPIQPLSTVHRAGYADYSHGVRLISQIVLINGEYKSIFDVLEDSTLAPVLTYEGIINDVRGLISKR